MSDLPPEMLDSQTPAEVIVTDVAPPRITDPTLGVPLGPPPVGAQPVPANPMNPLVTVGDSLTHGLSSGAVFHTGLSWPAQVATALGTTSFTFPSYGGPIDGLPLNIEKVARRLQDRFGTGMSWWEKLESPKELQDIFDENEDYWERGPGSEPPAIDVRYQNLGIYGWDLRDALSYTAARAAALAGVNVDDSIAGVKPDHDNDIAASSVLAPFGPDATQLSAAAWHGIHGGIDTLVVALGANNALDAVVSKRVSWSGDGFDRLDAKDAYNVWKPSHFAAEYALVVGAVKAITARRVILTTVPHVTIAPMAKGVNPADPGKKWQPGSRFFPYYTDPWIDDASFRPDKHRHLTHQQARAIDSAIDQYNTTITSAVGQARTEGRDWYVMDLCGLLDSLAYRRFDDDPLAAKRNDWVPYVLPTPIAMLDTRFFLSNNTGRIQGGLFGLDGIHPSITGYGIVAQEVLDVLAVAGATPHTIDFAALLQQDSLNAQPPALVQDMLEILAPFATALVSRSNAG